ncbi:DUF2325 domain-containing protein [Sporosarcina sp. ACRSL]|uniref:DUF2325 domain-containing protein n=1 Tax=Sporosarcina sp. ACRSL TaxID=2918215 RepID=UPI001EF6E2DD|nr:DUF2325 domain-containing protein [Sporosarcina sp. ACRSL]MCG7345939.1 DUF2325 domain-containing protein [Sporosarcina sp. ACRSL]
MKQISDELIQCIHNMTDDNVAETRERVNQLFDFIQLSLTLWGSIPSINASAEPEKKKPEDIGSSSNESSQRMIVTSSFDDAHLGTPMERKLKGGILKGKHGDVYVPEKIVRIHGFEHGDYIEAIGDSLKDLVFIKRKNSVTKHECNRIEIDYCVLTKTSDGLLVADQKIENGRLTRIKLDGESPYQFLISQKDIDSFRLTDGSVVTIAYHETDPLSFRVVWCYPEETSELAKPDPKPASFYKESTVKKENLWTDIELNLLKNKKIVIIGADFRSADFQPLADCGNFSLDIFSGDESKSRIKAAVRNKDLIISASEHSSHRSSGLAKECAKKYKIPFRATPTSQSSIKKAMIHGIKESYIPFHSFF